MSATAATTTNKKRGRNRSKAADEAILKATREVLSEKGYEQLSANDIISRAGVSSATLYRRYASLKELVTAALHSLGSEPFAIDEGSFHADLTAFIACLGEVLSRENRAADCPAAVPVDKTLREVIHNTFVAPRKAVLLQLLERAVAKGELASTPDIDDCWSLVSGPIHHRIFIRNQGWSPEFGKTLAAIICTGLESLEQ